jgi:ribosomal protein S18 acetylase RimI-like enzyme
MLIREIKPRELSFLEEILFEAIFIPDGNEKVSKEIIFQPELYCYVNDFGRKDDYCLIVEIDAKLVGAIWIRQFSESNKGYGFIDVKTPELSMAIDEEFRNQGIGKKLLIEMLSILKSMNYSQVSLSVDKRNFAYFMYKKFNFVDFKTDKNSVIMALDLSE